MFHIGNDWDNLLAEEVEKDYYKKLRTILKQEYKTQTIYPDMYSIFNALKLTSCADTKVLILGQDPYHGENQAHGLAFSVQKGVAIPPSLLNIYKELNSDLGLFVPNNGYLVKWAEQGVLLLNTGLTVRKDLANSHKGIGWEKFTDKIISCLNEKDEPMVYLLWGNNAKSKMELITNPKHLVLTTVHPSPLSASRGFFGCKHFSKTNEFLKNNGLKEIDWQIENI